MPFLEFLAGRFRLKTPVIRKMPKVSYKDFLSDDTFLICCDPAEDGSQPEKTDTCPGI
jgi:hypothetical protein